MCNSWFTTSILACPKTLNTKFPKFSWNLSPSRMDFQSFMLSLSASIMNSLYQYPLHQSSTPIYQMIFCTLSSSPDNQSFRIFFLPFFSSKIKQIKKLKWKISMYCLRVSSPDKVVSSQLIVGSVMNSHHDFWNLSIWHFLIHIVCLLDSHVPHKFHKFSLYIVYKHVS